MPELPDAVVYRRRLANAALDRPIGDTTVVDPLILGDGLEPHRLGEVLRGRPLTDTHRHGKHVFARYGEETGWLALHFGMTGRLQVVPDGVLVVQLLALVPYRHSRKLYNRKQGHEDGESQQYPHERRYR